MDERAEPLLLDSGGLYGMQLLRCGMPEAGWNLRSSLRRLHGRQDDGQLRLPTWRRLRSHSGVCRSHHHPDGDRKIDVLSLAAQEVHKVYIEVIPCDQQMTTPPVGAGIVPVSPTLHIPQ